MTNREKYIRLCEQQALPLHVQAWWLKCSAQKSNWDAIVIEEDGRIVAAMPYPMVDRFRLRAMLMPVHTQYHGMYIAENAPKDIYERMALALDNECRKQHICWCLLQGFYPPAFLQALEQTGFQIKEKTTYRMNPVPSRAELPSLFSQNKRRQLRKAEGMQLEYLDADTFYSFHRECMAKQGKTIDYPRAWAQSVLPEALHREQGLLLGARNKEGQLTAAMFLAWDAEYAYYLLPAYDPAHKDSGAMAWLTNDALCMTHDKGLGFDFEGSMTPSIASSYQQFGGQKTSYWSIEKTYNPLIKIAATLRRLV